MLPRLRRLAMAKQLPSAEDFWDEYHKEHPFADEVALMEEYARAVLEAASLVVGDAMPTGMLKDRVEHIMSKLKEDVR